MSASDLGGGEQSGAVPGSPSLKPQDQGIPGASGRSGLPPPAEYQFEPGKSGNPGGRPKGADLRAAVRRRYAAKPDAETGEGEKCAQVADELVSVMESVRCGAVKLADGQARMDLLLKLMHELSGRPSENDVDSGEPTRTVVLRGGYLCAKCGHEEGDGEAPPLPVAGDA